MMTVKRFKDKVWLLEETLDCFSTAKLFKVLFDFYRKKGFDLNTSVHKKVSLLLPAWSYVIKIMLLLK